jgi:hypothetical protein
VQFAKYAALNVTVPPYTIALYLSSTSIHLPIAGFCVGPDSAMTPCLLLPSRLLRSCTSWIHGSPAVFQIIQIAKFTMEGQSRSRILGALFSIPFEIEAALKEVKKGPLAAKVFHGPARSR